MTLVTAKALLKQDPACPAPSGAGQTESWLLAVVLGDVVTENRADRRERAVNAARQAGHAGSSCESHQRDDQHILDQTLASLVFMQPNQCIQNQVRHSNFSYYVAIPTAGRGVALGTPNALYIGMQGAKPRGGRLAAFII